MFVVDTNGRCWVIMVINAFTSFTKEVIDVVNEMFSVDK